MKFRDILMMSAAPGGGVPWTPLAVSPYAWWDASRSDLITRDGSNLVSSWKDIIAAYDLTQGTGSARPTYSATGFNGFPVVTGDGLDDELTSGTFPAGIPTGATACEWWWLVDQQVLVGDTAVKFIGGVGGGTLATSRALRRTVNVGVNRANLIDSSTSQLANTNVDFSGRHVVRSIATGTDIDLEVNGTPAVLTARVSAVGTERVRFFAAPTISTASSFFAGGIVAAICTPILSAGNAALMYAYLNQRR